MEKANEALNAPEVTQYLSAAPEVVQKEVHQATPASDDAKIEAALARARAVAASLSSSLTAPPPVAGQKRKAENDLDRRDKDGDLTEEDEASKGVVSHKRKVLLEKAALQLLVGDKMLLSYAEEQSKCKIILNSADGAGEDNCCTVVAATEEDTAKGEKELQALLLDPQAAALELKKRSLMQSLASGVIPSASIPQASTATERVVFNIPSSVGGTVIGHGGENIKAVQSQTGAHVSIEATIPGADTRCVTITGTAAACADAKRLVLAMAEEKLKADSAGGDSVARVPVHGLVGLGNTQQVSISVQVPDERAGAIIGRGGGNIKSIQSRTQTHINVPRECDPELVNGVKVRTLIIKGPAMSNCEAARAEVASVIQISESGDGGGGGGEGGGGGRRVGLTVPPGHLMATIQVVDDRAGAIIGRQGSTIQHLQDKTGCRIQVPNSADPVTGMRNVIIVGLPANVEMAKLEVGMIVQGTGNQGGGARGGGGGGGMSAFAGGAGGVPAMYAGYAAMGAAGGYNPQQMAAAVAAQGAYGGFNPYAANAAYAAYYSQLAQGGQTAQPLAGAAQQAVGTAAGVAPAAATATAIPTPAQLAAMPPEYQQAWANYKLYVSQQSGAAPSAPQ